MTKTLINTKTQAAIPLMQYPRPQRVARSFNIYLSGKKCEAVTTRGERYTYITVDGVDFFTDALLEVDGRYRVESVKEAAKS